ncbi:hypothetical protein PVAP13_3KG560150 [Panicum virgatum]|uniref:Uncharacterized protein n=1 Tax=Panicum virgatum TaxID=38727 RepID=A0A8T0V3C4_PANVG|nr:hypothetical protein PVAP13_3KG560150 [Panicum virgatum]
MRQTCGAAMDQVPRAHDLSFASVVPEHVAHPLLDEMSPLDVVWDEEVKHRLDSHGLLQVAAVSSVDWRADAVQAGLVYDAKHVRGNASRWRGLDWQGKEANCSVKSHINGQWCFTSCGAVS